MFQKFDIIIIPFINIDCLPDNYYTNFILVRFMVWWFGCNIYIVIPNNIKYFFGLKVFNDYKT